MSTCTSLTLQHGLATITLEREAVHNAFDAALIEELNTTLSALESRTECRMLVLTGRGASFSAGADLNWMRSMMNASKVHNVNDSLKLAELMRRLAYFPKPTIARVNGSAFGGGVGLIACCDIAIAADNAKFGLTESKLGLVPAVISPYVIDAIGARMSQRYFQTAEIFSAEKAREIGLLHEVVPAERLELAVTTVVNNLRLAGPVAVTQAKELVQRVSGRTVAEQLALDQKNAALIAGLRVSDEGQEGLSAFLEKRKPSWTLA